MKLSHLFLPMAALACVACASPADKAWSELYPQIEVEAKIAYDKLWNADADVAKIMQEVAKVYRTYLK